MATESTAPLVTLLQRDEAAPEAQAVLDAGHALYGKHLNTWRALAQRPEIFVAYLPYLRAVAGPGALDQRLKELVQVRVVVLNHCLYSTSHRVRSAKAAGVPEEDVVAAARGDLDAFTDRERVALELAEVLTVAPPAVAYSDAPQLAPPEMLERVRGALSEPEIVELVAAIGLWNALARFHRVMGFELDMDPPPESVAALL
jgi:AhpD family alkylhydroperoxidase